MKAVGTAASGCKKRCGSRYAPITHPQIFSPRPRGPAHQTRWRVHRTPPADAMPKPEPAPPPRGAAAQVGAGAKAPDGGSSASSSRSAVLPSTANGPTHTAHRSASRRRVVHPQTSGPQQRGRPKRFSTILPRWPAVTGRRFDCLGMPGQEAVCWARHASCCKVDLGVNSPHSARREPDERLSSAVSRTTRRRLPT